MKAEWNIARYLPLRAAQTPDKAAVIVQQAEGGFPQWSFQALEAMTNQYVRGFQSLGMKRGETILVMVQPGIDLIAITFALFKAGLVPVLIDPGMGLRNLLSCIDTVQPQGMIGIPKAHLMRLLYRSRFRSLKHLVTVGRRLFWGGVTLDSFQTMDDSAMQLADVKPDELAAILFTTGSTGPPKGVEYRHGIFDEQVELIQSYFKITENDVDMPAFPLFSLFSTAFGVTAVIPSMDPSRPALCDPNLIVRAIEANNVSLSFGSPSIWERVSEYCVQKKHKLPTLKKILMAGAPVSGYLIERMRSVLSDDAEIYTPYGATECLPVACITGSEISNTTFRSTVEGCGVCVGRPMPGLNVKVIGISDDPIERYSVALLEEEGNIGEIVVQGSLVTRGYYNLPEHTRRAKMQDRDLIWHRMGDVGYFDPEGRLWYCGRLAQRVVTAQGTLYPVRCEAIFKEHPDVLRSALVGVGKAGAKIPVMIIEPKSGRLPRSEGQKENFTSELLDLAEANPMTSPIHNIMFYLNFPVDIRHNAKIFREKLAFWAEGQEL